MCAKNWEKRCYIIFEEKSPNVIMLKLKFVLRIYIQASTNWTANKQKFTIERDGKTNEMPLVSIMYELYDWKKTASSMCE